MVFIVSIVLKKKRELKHKHLALKYFFQNEIISCTNDNYYYCTRNNFIIKEYFLHWLLAKKGSLQY